MLEKKLIPFARTLSMLFTPLYLPTVSMIALFTFSYLNMLHTTFKLQIIVATYLFTILMPTVLIHAYRKYHGWSPFHLRHRERRMVPYILSIASYFTFYSLMRYQHLPHFMSAIIVAALMVQIVCAIVNLWFKVSVHTAGTGGMAGGLIAYSLLFSFNPIWWLSLILIVSGLVGTARMILRVNTLLQVNVGFLLGAIVTFFVIILI